MTDSSVRVLALVGDAFGGHGGIAQYNREFLSALAGCDPIGEVIVLPRGRLTSPVALPQRVSQLRPVNGRLAYVLAAVRAAQKIHRVDVVFCGHLFMAPLAAALARVLSARLWIQVHGIEAWHELSWLHRRSVEMATLVTSVSRYTRARALQWIGIDPARAKVLPNTVDPRFRPGPKPVHLLDRFDARGKKVLVTVARLAASEAYKGHDRIIRALPHVLVSHPEALYIVVGDGDDRPRLEALAAAVGVADQVRFVGLVPAEEVPEYLRLADVFVMPSTGEGFGIAFLEAMATGIRVIGGNQDGSIDALYNAPLASAIAPQDSEALVSAINAALDKPMGSGESYVDRFGRAHFAQHVQALLKSIL